MPPSIPSPDVSSGSALSAGRSQGQALVGAAVALAGRVGGLAAWTRPALLAAGGLVAFDGVSHLLAPGSGLVVGLGALAGGCWLLSGRGPAAAGMRRPSDLQGWIERCEGLLPQFEGLEGDAAASQRRHAELERLTMERASQTVQIAVAGDQSPPASLAEALARGLRSSRPLQLHLGHPLAAASGDWIWPEGLAAADVLLFHLTPPLRASELRWLEALPAAQPVWLLLQTPGIGSGPQKDHDPAAELLRLWPGAEPQRLLLWDGELDTLGTALAPLGGWIQREGSGLRGRTGLRRIEDLHGRWQAELERLRRREAQGLLRRTQWVVAGGVLLAPLPSLDLLVLTIANGLMLREMADLWQCPWSLEQLRSAAAELVRVALAQGVVEWSSQALAGAIKWHGATWLVGGALQALSAAYLTRVVGHAMADMLAISAGVPEPDLAKIRLEAPLLVARAAEQERLDWGEFLRQARRWWDHQNAPAAI
jgi:hypothetical protein